MEREEAIRRIKAWNLDSDDMEVLAAIIPELAESEDERIKKALLALLNSDLIKVAGSTFTKQDLIGWVERQKPAESISQLTVQGKSVYKICPRCKERMVRDDSKVYTSIPPQYGYECPKCGEMEFDTVMYDNPEIEEQKLTEWSKDDTVFLNEITDFFENKTVRLQHDLDMYAHWLKSLPERFNLQPNQEWSEGDKGMLNCIIATLCEESHGGRETNDKMVTWLDTRFKFLRPHWKPSEINPKEVRLLDTTISFLKDFADKGYENAVECIDWLKSKRNGTACK